MDFFHLEMPFSTNSRAKAAVSQTKHYKRKELIQGENLFVLGSQT